MIMTSNAMIDLDKILATEPGPYELDGLAYMYLRKKLAPGGDEMAANYNAATALLKTIASEEPEVMLKWLESKADRMGRARKQLADLERLCSAMAVLDGDEAEA